jgi:hypothetical protein
MGKRTSSIKSLFSARKALFKKSYLKGARHCQLSRPWSARCVGGAAARVGRSFARLVLPVLTERGRKKAPWVR